MKFLPFVTTAAGLLAFAAASLPAQDALPTSPGPQGSGHAIINGKRGDETPPREQVAFLGVDVSPVSDDLRDQLGLPENTGLVVEHVSPGSPADGILQPHDVLTKLDDQSLIDLRQFFVLVRNHHSGDEVTLAYIRGGKAATVTAKLSQQEATKLADREARIGPAVGEIEQLGREYSQALMEKVREAQQKVRAEQEQMRAQGERLREQFQGARADVFLGANGRLTLTNESGRRVELTAKDGKKTLTVVDAVGKQVFSGPVDTAEERKVLPPDVAEDLGRLEDMRGIRLDTNSKFPAAPPPPATPAAPAI